MHSNYKTQLFLLDDVVLQQLHQCSCFDNSHMMIYLTDMPTEFSCAGIFWLVLVITWGCVENIYILDVCSNSFVNCEILVSCAIAAIQTCIESTVTWHCPQGAQDSLQI